PSGCGPTRSGAAPAACATTSSCSRFAPPDQRFFAAAFLRGDFLAAAFLVLVFLRLLAFLAFFALVFFDRAPAFFGAAFLVAGFALRFGLAARRRAEGMSSRATAPLSSLMWPWRKLAIRSSSRRIARASFAVSESRTLSASVSIAR